MTIKTAANNLAAAWAAGRFSSDAESRKSEEARALRVAIVEACLKANSGPRRYWQIADAVLRRHNLTSKVYTL